MHRYFDRVIILAIVINSVILGLSDFSVVDNELNPTSNGVAYVNGTMVPATSLANLIVEKSEIPFTTLFTAECGIKIVAMGFAGREGSYLRDSWNMLDFVVVISRSVSVALIANGCSSTNIECLQSCWYFAIGPQRVRYSRDPRVAAIAVVVNDTGNAAIDYGFASGPSRAR